MSPSVPPPPPPPLSSSTTVIPPPPSSSEGLLLIRRGAASGQHGKEFNAAYLTFALYCTNYWVHLSCVIPNRAPCNSQFVPEGKKLKKSLQKFRYHSIVYHYFAYNSGGKSRSYLVGLLRHENPDLSFLGTLKNRLQICQKYDPSHHDFVV